MLPKKERLTKADFTKIRPRIIFRGAFVDIATIPAPFSRFACVIAKKRVKKAVDRNLIKRKVYHSLQDNRPIITNLVIIYPKITSLEGSYSQIKKEITEGFATL